MKLVSAEDAVTRPITVNRNYSVGEFEHVRTAQWSDGDTVVTVEVIAYVSGIRAQRNSDGSVDLLGLMSRFDVLGKNQFMQPVERAVFLWNRRRPDPSGGWVVDTDMDYSNEIGVFYKDTIEEASANARLWLEELDFEAQFDPAAWEIPVNG